ncbi:MAG: HK97 gp10 family phage protein [Nitrosomonas sp.]|nr:HK97 gp10 family phage protein [Nitrosomonas sp.]
MAEIKVKGLDELQSFLDQLPAKVEANIMRAALRAGAKPILAAAKANVPVGEPSRKGAELYKHYSGALRDSIRVSARIDRREGKVTASIKAGGKVGKTGANVFYAHMVEFGTRPHSLSKNGKG